MLQLLQIRLDDITVKFGHIKKVCKKKNEASKAPDSANAVVATPSIPRAPISTNKPNKSAAVKSDRPGDCYFGGY